MPGDGCDVLLPADRPSPVVAVITSFTNGVLVAWGLHALITGNESKGGSGVCSATMANVWLGLGVGCAVVNILFSCWFVWQLQRRVTAGAVAEDHNILRFVLTTPRGTVVYGAVGLVVELFWMAYAMDVYHVASAAIDNHDPDCETIVTLLPIGVSVLCVHWALLLTLVPLTIMTECGKMPRWRLRAIVRAIRRRELEALGGRHGVRGGGGSAAGQPRTRGEYDELDESMDDDDAADVPFTVNLSRSMASVRHEQSKLHQRRSSSGGVAAAAAAAGNAAVGQPVTVTTSTATPPPSLQPPLLNRKIPADRAAAAPPSAAAPTTKQAMLPTAMALQRLAEKKAAAARDPQESGGNAPASDVPKKAVFGGGVPARQKTSSTAVATARSAQASTSPAASSAKYLVASTAGAAAALGENDDELPDFDE